MKAAFSVCKLARLLLAHIAKSCSCDSSAIFSCSLCARVFNAQSLDAIAFPPFSRLTANLAVWKDPSLAASRRWRIASFA